MKLSDIMSRIGSNTKIELSDEEKSFLVNQVESHFLAAYNKIKKNHREWYIIDRFIDGDHWVVYNKVNNTIQNLPVSSGETRRSINLIDTQLRAVKNFITRNEMRMEVHPADSSVDSNNEKAEAGQIITQYYYRKNKIKKQQGLLVDEGLRHGVSYIEISWAGEDSKGVPKINIDIKSSYDVFLEPNATELKVDKCRYVITTSKEYVDEIKENKDYDLIDENTVIDYEQKESASEYKSKLERDRNKMSAGNETEELKTAIVKHLHFRYKEKGSDSYSIGLISVVGNTLLQVKKLNISEYNIIPYYPELKADQIYPKPWAMNVITPNKAVDKMSSHIENYVLKMLNGKILAKEGAIVNKVTDKQGEIVKWKGSQKPEEMSLQPLPSTPFEYMRMAIKFIEDLGGMHPSSLGALPAANQSGRSIEALQAADANNVADPIKNLSHTLTELTLRLFDLLRANVMTKKTVSFLQDGKKKEASFVGAKPLTESPEALENYKNEGVYVIDETEVDIELVPGLAYTEAGRYDKLVELVKYEVIPPEYLLKELRFSNVGDIVRSLEKSQRMKAVNNGIKPGGEPSVNPIELANMENQSLAGGQEIPPTPPELAIAEHTNLHKVFIEQMRAEGKTDEELQLLLNHYNLEVNQI